MTWAAGRHIGAGLPGTAWPGENEVAAAWRGNEASRHMAGEGLDQGNGAGDLAQGCCQAGHFTDREIEVLSRVAAGLTNDEIAAAEDISSYTVAGHLRMMMQRCEASSRAELVARAYAAGVLIPGAWPPHWSGRRCLPLSFGSAAGALRPRG